MNDKELENLLMDGGLDERFDHEVVKKVIPGKKNWTLIVMGMICIIFDVYQLVGCVALMLGFRGFKRANKWFLVGYIFSICNVIYVYGYRFIGSSIRNEEIWSLAFFENGIGHYLGIIFSVVIFTCLWRAIVSAEKEAGITVHSVSPLMLVIWYVLVSIINIMGVAGEAANIIIIVGFMVIAIGIASIYKEFEDGEYVLRSSKIIIPDMVWLFGILVIYYVIGIGIYMNNQHPMEWNEVVTIKNEKVENIKYDLIELGVPQKVLDDMSDEDILQCEGAVEAFVYENTLEDFDTEEKIIDTINVSLKLDEQGYIWRMIYYFEYAKDIKFYGSEAISIWDEEYSEGNAIINGDVVGRLLCEKDGKTLTSKYYGLYEKEYSYEGMRGIVTGIDIIGKYSFDNKMDNCRGYVTYEIEEVEQFSFVPTSYVDYIHLKKRYMYPAVTASDTCESDLEYSPKVFNIISDYAYRGLFEGVK